MKFETLLLSSLIVFCINYFVLAAARACSKKRHSIEGVSFQLRIPKVTTFRDDAIMLCNIQPSTSKNLRSMYLEKLAGSAPQNVISSHDNSVVIGTFSCKIGKTFICCFFHLVTA